MPYPIPSGKRLQFAIENCNLVRWFTQNNMVIFHSYVNVYQRVYHIYVFQIVLYYILHELLTIIMNQRVFVHFFWATTVLAFFAPPPVVVQQRWTWPTPTPHRLSVCSLGSPNLASGYVKIAIEHDHSGFSWIFPLNMVIFHSYVSSFTRGYHELVL